MSFTAIVMMAVLFSCSVEKNTGMSRGYHNLTSHYNTYFNGKEAYKKGAVAAIVEEMVSDTGIPQIEVRDSRDSREPS